VTVFYATRTEDPFPPLPGTPVVLPPDRPEWAAERGAAQALREVEQRSYDQGMRDFADAQAKRLADRAKPAPSNEGKSLGSATLADIQVGPEPQQLVGPFLSPDGVTVLYGRGGVGKGMVSIWLVGQLVELGHNVMVVDYEGHPKEWARRARNMGWDDEQLRSVHYRAPFGDDWEASRGALFEVSDLLSEEVRDLGIGYVIVDSYTTSTSSGDGLGGKDAAQEFFTAMARIGAPALVIAHVAGNQSRFPDKPFGSVFVHNLARETWAVEKANDNDEPEYDPKTAHLQPRVMQLELRQQKKNDGAKAPPQFLSFSFHANGDIDAIQEHSQGRTLGDLIRQLIPRLSGKATVKAIVSAIKTETGETVAEDTVRRTMKRSPKRFIEVSASFPTVWSVR
jgi:hypothetical protein